MNLPTSVVITGIDNMQILEQAIQAAKTFKPMSAAGVESLLAKTKQAAADGQFELFKTSQHFDSTAEHPEWLGGESPHVRQVAKPS
jgi:ABC-type branched-subunit amino acid transport system substrate-binding protein